MIMQENKPIRVRFAPSPTGPLHIGGVRTALFNYLFAKKYKGAFILRIEDTDQTRYVEGAETYIKEALKWCGLHYTEGPDIGGPHAPYKQSERNAIYKQYADKLIATGNAYYAFDSADELDKLRKDAELMGKAFAYDVNTRNSLNNSLSLSKNEVEEKLNNKQSFVIRFKMPANEDLLMNDLIRGEVRVNTSTLDDKVLYKSDGLPTYHLANVVDDYLMEISHVIRGEEWLPSMPLHVLLYRSFGWQNAMPQFAHLPLILKPSGKGKLSKRDGDQLGFPVFPIEWKPANGESASGYRESGYFPDAFINMLALLGWNSTTEQEVFSIDELAAAFSLEKVSKSGARFDPDKAKWFNGQYLQKKNDQELIGLYLDILKKKNIVLSPDKAAKIVSLVKERAVFTNDLWDQSVFFFEAPLTYDEKVIAKRWKPNTNELLQVFMETIKTSNCNNVEEYHDLINSFVAEKAIGHGDLMLPLRICLVGSTTGPDLFEIINFIGKTELITRIEKLLKK